MINVKFTLAYASLAHLTLVCVNNAINSNLLLLYSARSLARHGCSVNQSIFAIGRSLS